MDITEKDRIFIKQYKGLSKCYLSLFVFIVIFGAVQFYLFFSKYIPIYINTLHSNPELQDFFRVGLMRCVGASFIWIALLIGVLVGDLYTRRKVLRIFDKVT
jgi:hypothetical protein